jgi:hypothetical protein
VVGWKKERNGSEQSRSSAMAAGWIWIERGELNEGRMKDSTLGQSEAYGIL